MILFAYMKDTASTNSSIKGFIDRFNKLLGSFYTDKPPKVRKQYHARIEEGWDNDMMMTAAYGASKDPWLMGKHPNNSRRYLTPEYITRSDKLEYWYNEGMRQLRIDEAREEQKRINDERAREMEEFRKNGGHVKNPQIEALRQKLASKLNLS